MKKVLLVGCGNIGFRHLQALVAMDAPADLIVVEPEVSLHSRIEDLISADAARNKKIVLHRSAEDAPDLLDLVVVATNALHRRQAWEAVSSGRRISAVIFEKILFPRIRDLDEVSEALTVSGTSAYVNCGRRGFPSYQFLRENWVSHRPLSLHVAGDGWGMGSNTIHFLDIAEFLNNSSLISVDVSGLQSGMKPSKRSGYVEIFGRIQAELENGARVTLDCGENGGEPLTVRWASNGELDVTIDEGGKQLTHAGQEPKVFESRHVSEMPEIYSELLEGRGGVLTPYADSARQHRLFISALRPHLGLSNQNDELCPIS